MLLSQCFVGLVTEIFHNLNNIVLVCSLSELYQNPNSLSGKSESSHVKFGKIRQTANCILSFSVWGFVAYFVTVVFIYNLYRTLINHTYIT